MLTLTTPDAVDTLDRTVPTVVRDPLRTLFSVASVAASLAVLAVLATVAVDAARHRRAALVQALVAGLLGLLLGAVAERSGDAAGGVVADVLTGPRDDAALVPVVATIAFLVGADLQRRRRWRAPARWVVLAALVCGVALGNLTMQGAVAAVLLGAVAGLAVRLAAGVSPARPGDDVLRAELARAGVVVTALEVTEQHAGLVRLTGSDEEGPVCVTVVDPDGRGLPLVRRAGRMLRFRAAVVGRPSLSQRGDLERETSSKALAAAAGVPVPPVVALLAVGPALVLVERPLPGTPLTEAGDGAEAGLAAAFAALRRLHAVGLAHGALTPDSVLLDADGAAGFRDLRAAQPAAGELQRDLDTVALLVGGATVVGAAAAVAALQADRTPGPTPARVPALLQPVALPAAVRRAVRGTELLAELRRALAGPDGTVAAAPRLERFSVRTILTVAASTVAAVLLASQLSQVSVVDELRRADPLWLLVALGGSALTYVGAALALIPFVPVALSLGRTTLVQVSSAWLTLVTPPTVGHVGINIRYLQRAGLAVGAAAASVAVSQVATVAATVLLLLVVGWASGVSASRLSLVPSGEVLLVLLGAVAVVGLLLAVAPARRLLVSRLEPLLRQSLPQLLATATEPRRLATALGGILLQNAGYVLALDASLRAFDASLALPTVIGVYLVSSAVGSVAPTPGGLGAVEAALLGGLTATGVPVSAALAAVLAFRTVTFWLPAPVGWVAFVRLQSRRYI
ncbi:flippase-like domain-containing protein [Blastococcus sp. TML/M2B]|uniref:lysylphosphatidylglycerol synthase transmembrane domain-containing protein n=1 Tax=Blastococcus sp. TML/M2B TaxID=2798727 RepID=UPI00190B4B33|nr:lysylphosphatidylglycerol synthase transmembrane domain-containing protein [Blastococcus sp. TML/M2B]MBN1092869.1 flippase-like domain-containing protein [Blastococcus sp. TML/M2B]